MKKRLFLALFTILFLSVGCSRKTDSGWASYAPDETRRLTIYTSHQKEVYEPLVEEFEERTGIWVSIETGNSLELLQRIENETANVTCDLLFGGNADSFEAKKQLFSPYKSPEQEALLPAFSCPDFSWTPVSVIPVVLLYNPKLVRNNLPGGIDSLWDSAWKGNIAFADPAVSAFSCTVLSMIWEEYKKPEPILKALYTNLDGTLLNSSSQIVSTVAHGNSYIGIDSEAHALMGIRNGYDLALIYPQGGTCAVPDAAAIISGCPHEENARLFLDFLLSADAQNFLQENCARRSVRKDILPSPEFPDKENWLSFDISRSGAAQEEILALWKSYSGEVQP